MWRAGWVGGVGHFRGVHQPAHGPGQAAVPPHGPPAARKRSRLFHLRVHVSLRLCRGSRQNRRQGSHRRRRRLGRPPSRPRLEGPPWRVRRRVQGGWWWSWSSWASRSSRCGAARAGVWTSPGRGPHTQQQQQQQQQHPQGRVTWDARRDARRGCLPALLWGGGAGIPVYVCQTPLRATLACPPPASPPPASLQVKVAGSPQPVRVRGASLQGDRLVAEVDGCRCSATVLSYHSSPQVGPMLQPCTAMLYGACCCCCCCCCYQ